MSALLLLAAANLVAILMGGYQLALGPLRVAAHDLWIPLRLTLGLAILTVWLRDRRTPATARLRSPLLLFLGVLFAYSLSRSGWRSGDTAAAAHLPLSILREFNLDLDEFPFLYEPTLPYFLKSSQGHVVSAYPPWAAVLASPVYLLPVLGGLSPHSALFYSLEQLAASAITALSVVVLYATLRRMTGGRTAWLIALVYAFGTSSLSTSSRALWQHGPSQLFLSLTVYSLVRALETPRYFASAGFALACAVLSRPTNVFIGIPILAYIVHQRRDQLPRFLLSALPPMSALAVYNYAYFGSPVTLAFASQAASPGWLWDNWSALFGTPLPEGIAGVLVSPARGLLIYSPILLVAFAGMVRTWTMPGGLLLKYLAVAPVPIILLTAKWSMWWGGHSYGPRLLADITPILSLFLYPAFESAQARRSLKSLLVVLAALSVGLHALVVFDDGSWNDRAKPKVHRERLWAWRDSPIEHTARRAASEVRHALPRLRRTLLAMPTSRDAPDGLRASYRMISPVPGTHLSSSESLALRVRADNTGEAVWLARSNRGRVFLEWGWVGADGRVLHAFERIPLGRDLFPGQSYEFRAMLAAPATPGEYVLEVGLISEAVARFSERGTAPATVRLRVVRPPSGYIER